MPFGQKWGEGGGVYNFSLESGSNLREAVLFLVCILQTTSRAMQTVLQVILGLDLKTEKEAIISLIAHALIAMAVFLRCRSCGISGGKPLPLARQNKKDFPFVSCGASPSRTVPQTQPVQVAFSLRERVDLSSQKGGDFGGRKLPGEGCGGQGKKKGKKDATKKRWLH